MYMDQLKVSTVDVECIFLDPNNPRFWTEKNAPIIPDKKITNVKVQSDARSRIDKFGIDELYNSILRNGFLLLDRIVVRPIKDQIGKFVVVEGNRRFRALSKLREDIEAAVIDEDGIDGDYLARMTKETKSIEVLVYEGSEGNDISWMLQGIRHISGITAWEPAQRAKLVADQIDTEKQSFRAAGQTFGLSPQAVGRLYRTYKALEQMRADEEFGSKARNDYFTLFEEAYRNSTTREWLGWDDEKRKFTNTARLKRFYAWITPDEEDTDRRRRIHDPRQMKELAYLLASDQAGLLSEFEEHDITIGDAYARAKAGGPKVKDWRKSVETAYALIADLPQSAMFDETQPFIQELSKLASLIAQRKKAAEGIANG